MTSKAVDGVGLATVTIGSILVYAGTKGFSMLAVMQNLITGKPIATDVTIINPLKTPGTAVGAAASEGIQGVTGMGVNPAGSPKQIGQSLAAGMGWTGVQWDSLVKLWDGESNWNPRAKNSSSGAYGIPQALPHTKMPKAAWPESAGGSSDARTQIQWGLNYIKQRYGTPQMAWAFWQRQSPHWY